jgi:hypothetical protein
MPQILEKAFDDAMRCDAAGWPTIQQGSHVPLTKLMLSFHDNQ